MSSLDWLTLAWMVTIWGVIIYCGIRKLRSGRVGQVPVGLIPIVWAWREFVFALQWYAFLLREWQAGKRRKRVADFLRNAQETRDRGPLGDGVGMGRERPQKRRLFLGH